VWTFVYAAVPFAVPYLVLRQRRTAEPEPPASSKLTALRIVSSVLGAAILAGAIALYIVPVDLGKHWLWALTPLLARAVASWYALFGTMLISCAIGMRRPADAIVPYATLGTWSVLLLLLPVFQSEQVSGGGLWYGLTAALLALSVVALAVGLPDRKNL
jgi:hypothetical protein